MSGIWGPQSAMDLYLQEEGITSLLFAGVNADQVRFSPYPRHMPAQTLTSPRALVRPRDHRRLILQRLRLHRPQGLHRHHLADRRPRERPVQLRERTPFSPSDPSVHALTLCPTRQSYGFVTDSVKIKEAARLHAGHH